MKLFLAIFLFPLCALAQLVNPTYKFTDFSTAPLRIQDLYLTPLDPYQNYNGAILAGRDIHAVRSALNGTNSYTFTNIVSGYHYRATAVFSDYTATRTNGFPIGLSGNVNASSYPVSTNDLNYFTANVLVDLFDTTPGPLAGKLSFIGATVTTNNPGANESLSVTITGGVGGVPLASGTNTAVRNVGGTNYVDVTPSLTNYYPLSSNPSAFLTTNGNGHLLTGLAWSALTGLPTTLSGYGITDAYPLGSNPSNYLTTNGNGHLLTGLTESQISGLSSDLSTLFGDVVTINGYTLTLNGTANQVSVGGASNPQTIGQPMIFNLSLPQDIRLLTSGSEMLSNANSGNYITSTNGATTNSGPIQASTFYGDASHFSGLTASQIPSLDAGKITTGVFPIARLATGTPNGSKFVRDDGTLAAPSGGGSPSTFNANQFDGQPSGTNIPPLAKMTNLLQGGILETNYADTTGFSETNRVRTYYTNGAAIFYIRQTNNLMVFTDSNQVDRIIITNGGGIWMDNVTINNLTNLAAFYATTASLVTSNAQFLGSITNNGTAQLSNVSALYLTVSNDPPVYTLTAHDSGTNFIIDRANGPRQKFAANTNLNVVYFTNSGAGNCDGQVSLVIFTTNNPNGPVNPILSFPTNWNAGTTNLFSLTSGFYATTITNNGHKVSWITFAGTGPGTSQTNVFWSGLLGQP